MLYTFFEIDSVTPALFSKWLGETPAQRRDYILKYRFEKDRLLSLCSYRLLCFALGIDKAEFSFGTHGKPELPGVPLQFNITHCTGCVAVCVSLNEIGVDAEALKPYPKNTVNRIFTENEAKQLKTSPQPDITFFKLWTLKESYIKAIGKGLSFPLKNIEFFISEEITSCSDKNYSCASYVMNSHVISLCEKRPLSGEPPAKSELKIIGLDELANP